MPKRKIEDVDSEGEQGGESAGSEDSNSSVQTSSSTDVPTTETASTSGTVYLIMYSHQPRQPYMGSHLSVKFYLV